MIRIWFNLNHAEGLHWAVECYGKVTNVKLVIIDSFSFTNVTDDKTKHPRAWIECKGSVVFKDNIAHII